MTVYQQQRSTSWIAWEQPDPALYARPLSNGQQQTANTNQANRNVGESVTAPSTAAVGCGSQEVSTSGKTVPPTIQAGSSNISFTQKRMLQTASPSHNVEVQVQEAKEDSYLPKTLLCIPGVSSTWPHETEPTPTQKRVRKLSLTDDEPLTLKEKNQGEKRALSTITVTVTAPIAENNKPTITTITADASQDLESHNAFLAALRDYEAVSSTAEKAIPFRRISREDQKRYSYPLLPDDNNDDDDTNGSGAQDNGHVAVKVAGQKKGAEKSRTEENRIET